MTLASANLGKRVSVRFFLGYPGPSGGPAMSDVVGVLESFGASAAGDHERDWQVRRRDGSLVTVAAESIVSVRSAPGRTAELSSSPTIGLAELEQIAAAGWQPTEQVMLGEWRLRAAAGFTGRANSAFVVGEPNGSIETALTDVANFYRQRSLQPRIQVPLPLKHELDDVLSQSGWQAESPTMVMTAHIAAVWAQMEDRQLSSRVKFAAEPSDAWLSTYSYKGEPIPAVARVIMTNATHPVFASIAQPDSESGSASVAIARGAITGTWLGVTALDVLAAWRRRGLATTVMHGLLDYARQQGCRNVYLQVAADNFSARAMYDKLGFVSHHSYHYRVFPFQPDDD